MASDTDTGLVARVARAIWDEAKCIGVDTSYDELLPGDQEPYQRYAAAAIAAIRSIQAPDEGGGL